MQAISKAELSFAKADRPERVPAVASGSSAVNVTSAADAPASGNPRGAKVRVTLRARLGDDICTSWFNALEFDEFDGKTVKVSVPVTFLRNWIQSHYLDDLPTCCRTEFKTAERVEVVLRQPGGNNGRAAQLNAEPVKRARVCRQRHAFHRHRASPSACLRAPRSGRPHQRRRLRGFAARPSSHVLDTFVVGTSNRIAHAGAIQVAETIPLDSPAFNPLYIYSSVGMGKTSLASRHRLGSGNAAPRTRRCSISPPSASALSSSRRCAIRN